MRLTGGEGKGRKLVDPPAHVRPTGSRAREVLFNIWRSEVPGARVLDLYAGSGILGLEALARGACAAHFVERDRKALQTIQRNLEICRFHDKAELVRGEVLGWLRAGPVEGPWDLVVADPPYGEEVAGELLAALSGQRLLAEGGEVMVELPARREPPVPRGWTLRDSRRLGDTLLAFYQATAGGAD
jgi:16S rRNA (guanine966-N2)-methyltransferase